MRTAGQMCLLGIVILGLCRPPALVPACIGLAALAWFLVLRWQDTR